MQTITQTLPQPKLTVRALGSITLGVAITFGLFVVMAKLIEQDHVVIDPSEPVTLGPVILDVDEPEVIEKNKIKPMEKPIQPPPKELPRADETPNNEVTDFTIGPINTVTDITIDTSVGGGITDGTATPIFRVDPTYPVDAARNGTEGWVKLSFSISPTGTVQDISVIDAKPKRIFDRAARRALARWKYKPTVVNGTAVSQPNMNVLLEFKLDQ